MKLRLLKYFGITSIAVVGLVAAFAAFGYYFPPTYEATTKIANSDSQLVIELEPMHPYLAEYRRVLVLRTDGKPDQRIEMFPDTGGYSRAQLYRLSNIRYVVRGYFDDITIDLSKRSFDSDQNSQNDGTYLGAFDRNADGDWRFMDASQSVEQALIAGGG